MPASLFREFMATNLLHWRGRVLPLGTYIYPSVGFLESNSLGDQNAPKNNQLERFQMIGLMKS